MGQGEEGLGQKLFVGPSQKIMHGYGLLPLMLLKMTRRRPDCIHGNSKGGRGSHMSSPALVLEGGWAGNPGGFMSLGSLSALPGPQPAPCKVTVAPVTCLLHSLMSPQPQEGAKTPHPCPEKGPFTFTTTFLNDGANTDPGLPAFSPCCSPTGQAHTVNRDQQIRE